MRMTRIMFKRVRVPIAFGVGMLTGVSALAGTAFADLYWRGVESQRADFQQAVQAAAAELSEVDAPGDPASTLDELDGLRIVGHLQYGKSMRYVLERKPETEGAPPERFASDELVRAGYDVTGRSDCQLEVRQGAQSRRITCI